MLYAVLNVSTALLTGHTVHVSTSLTKVWRNVTHSVVMTFRNKPTTMCMIFPTLSQTKPRKNPRLQYAFNIQVLVVFCNSHWLSHLAAIFIDKRAEWSTVYSRIFSLNFLILVKPIDGTEVPFWLAHISNGTFAWLAWGTEWFGLSYDNTPHHMNQHFGGNR